MIGVFSDFETFAAHMRSLGLDADLSRLLHLDMNFLETYQGHLLVNLREAIPLERAREDISSVSHILSLDSKDAFAYSPFSHLESESRKFVKALAKPNGESTVVFYLIANEVLKSYYKKMEDIRKIVNSTPVDHVDADFLSQQNRRVLDRAEDLLAIVLTVRSREFAEVDWDILKHDLEILAAQTQNLIDRSRSMAKFFDEHRRQLDIRATRSLNETVERLTHVMALLTVVGIVISIPNTIATIFGVGKIADEFTIETIHFWIWVSTVAAIVLGFLYWKSVVGQSTWPKRLDAILNGIRKI